MGNIDEFHALNGCSGGRSALIAEVGFNIPLLHSNEQLVQVQTSSTTVDGMLIKPGSTGG